MRVYISGPISGLPRDVYERAFANRAQWVSGQGWEPVNPVEVKLGACACPGEHEWSCYMRFDLLAMLGCDAITTLPGWERSHGARAEVFVAGVAGLTFVGPTGEVRSA